MIALLCLVDTARKRCDDQYHKISDRSEFYSMLDLTTQPVLFNPVPDYEDYCTKVSHICIHIAALPPSCRRKLSNNCIHVNYGNKYIQCMF